MDNKAVSALLGVLCVVVLLHCGEAAVKMNHIRMVGTHNSYHIPSTRATVPQWTNVKPPLTQQMDCTTTRKFEIDFYAESGFPVLHIKTYDANSNCADLATCFQEIADWSAAHGDHLPIYVFLEYKTEPSSAQWDTIDALIRSTFNASSILDPDTIQGGAASVKEAVTGSTGWPLLADVRGKIVIVINSVSTNYLVGGTSLTGRAALVGCEYADRANGYCAIVMIGDPTGTGATDINTAVSEGYMVRTRADGDYIPGTYTSDQLYTASFYMMDLNDDSFLVQSEIENFFTVVGGLTLTTSQKLLLATAISSCGTANKLNVDQFVSCLIPAASSFGYDVGAIVGSLSNKSEAITQRTAALATNAHWTDTDYPVAATGDDYYVAYANGWVECLSVFSGQGCTSADLAETTVTSTCGACCASGNTCDFTKEQDCTGNFYAGSFCTSSNVAEACATTSGSGKTSCASSSVPFFTSFW